MKRFFYALNVALSASVVVFESLFHRAYKKWSPGLKRQNKVYVFLGDEGDGKEELRAEIKKILLEVFTSVNIIE